MSSPLRRVLGWITVVAVFVSVLTYALAIVVGFAAVSATQLGSQLFSLNGFLPVEAFLLFIPTPLPINLLTLVIACLIVFCVCFVAAAWARGGFISSLRTLSRGSRPSVTPNWLAVMPLVGSTLLIIVLLLTLIQDVAGLSTGSLNAPSPSILFADLAYSPIAEEIGFRVTAIGLAVGIITILRTSFKTRETASQTGFTKALKMLLLTLVSPDYVKERAGLPSISNSGWRGVHWAEWFFVIATSTVFGIDHITSGAGWGPGKALTAGLSGFVLALVYLAYGAYANILLHWFFNFYLYVYGTYTAVIFGDLVVLGVLAVGAWGIIVGISWLVDKKPPSITPTTVQYVEAPPRQPSQ